MIFPQFNCAVNPSDEPQYTIKRDLKTKYHYKEIIEILKSEPNTEIIWNIPKDYICIKMLSSHTLVPLLIRVGAKVMAFESKLDGCTYIICKSALTTKATKSLVGLPVQYIRGQLVLPFKLKSATSKILTSMAVIYSKGIGDIPDILYPSDSKYSFVIPIMGNPTDVLTLILRNLPRWSLEKKKSIITIINDFFCKEKRTSDELDAIISRASETSIEDFFNGSEFKHDALGEYLIKLLHVKKDNLTGDLYYYDNVKQVYDKNPDYLYSYITKNYSSLKEYQRKEVIQFINYYLYEDSISMNNNPYTIVFNNGILDIRDMSLKPMSPDYNESIKIGFNFSKYAYSETVDEFFNNISCKDNEVKSLLFEAIGYALLKTSELQTTFTLVGSGRNGKSTYLDLLKKIVGRGNFTSISYKDLANNFRAADLLDKLCSIADDISAQPLNDSDLYKSIAAGEDVMLERKFKDAKTLPLFATLFFSCNKLPRTPDTSDGFFRRQTLIPFDADLSSISKVDGMKFKLDLMSNEAIEYAIYRAVLAIHEVFKRGDFTKSSRVETLKKEYKADNSSVLSWIKDMYGTPDRILKMTFKNAWKSYKVWCEDSSRKNLNQTNFRAELKANGIDLSD